MRKIRVRGFDFGENDGIETADPARTCERETAPPNGTQAPEAAGGGSASTGEDKAGNGAAATSVKVVTVEEVQAGSVEARARKRSKDTEAALVGGDATLTTRGLDEFPKEWWTQMVRYFSLLTLVRLHLTCTSIKNHALPSKCLYICVRSASQLPMLTLCQASVERVMIQLCRGVYDPTVVVERLGACTSLKVWHFEQTPRGVDEANQVHLTAPVQVNVSQLTTLQTFLQKQPRCVSCVPVACIAAICGHELLNGCVCGPAPPPSGWRALCAPTSPRPSSGSQ